MNDLLYTLIDFTTADARLETSCLFHKVHAGRHRLGLQTSQLVEEMDRAAQTAYQTFLQDRRGAGDWYGAVSIDVAAKFLGEQIALALAQPAAEENAANIRKMLSLVLSVFR